MDLPALRDAVADPRPVTEQELFRLVGEANRHGGQPPGGPRTGAPQAGAPRPSRRDIRTFGAAEVDDSLGSEQMEGALAPAPTGAPPPPPPEPRVEPAPVAEVQPSRWAEAPAAAPMDGDGLDFAERPRVLAQKRREIIQIIKGGSSDRASSGGRGGGAAPEKPQAK
ncbi:MAG TPA: hypothetical protein VEU33_12455, partial [Archangium sp.]|nr:hypothetical protein [Archangium sp.]